MSKLHSTFEEVTEWVIRALTEFAHNDYELVAVDANERSITHHIAKYLEKFVPTGFVVDCQVANFGFQSILQLIHVQ